MAGFRRPAPAACTRWGSPGTTAASSRASADVDVCFTVRSQSVHRIQEAQALVGHACGPPCDDRLGTDDDERRDRRPRRLRDRGHRPDRGVPPPTAAAQGRDRHDGARGRRQVLGRAGGRGVRRGVPQRGRSSATAPCSTLPGGERLAFSTDSFVVQPLRFPGGSIGHLAVHGTVNDLPWRARGRAGCPPRSCWRRASRSPSCGTIVADMATRRTPRACRSSPATPRSSHGRRRRALHHDRRRRRDPRRAARSRPSGAARRPRDARAPSATTAWP